MLQSGHQQWSGTGLAIALLLGGQACAQVQTVPDAQIEANVLKSLAEEPQVANENIISNTVYGTVTLSGTVKDEPTRLLAETLVSRTTGVTKVMDQLTLRTTASTNQETSSAAQSGGSVASASAQHAPDPDTYAAQHGIAPPGTQASGQGTSGQGTSGQSMPPDDSSLSGRPGYRPPYDAQHDAQTDQAQQSYLQGSPYDRGQQPPPPHRQPSYAPVPYGAQIAGEAVTVPVGSLIRVRLNEGLDSRHSQSGTPFDAVVLNDVVADGAVAIPRGASVQGTVVDARSGGAIKGRGKITLRLNQVTLSGRTFPITSDIWSLDSSDKRGQTIGSAVGLGAFGAIIGAVAGGGPGAAIGAVAGGAAGVGTSAASGGREVLVPSEAIIAFHLTQPASMTTISQAEMDRLSYGTPNGFQQSMRRRVPPPPPFDDGPVYYPRPYPIPYPVPY